MKPKLRPESNQLQLFQAQLEQLLDQDHPLFQLANQVDWSRFEVAFSDCYSPDMGAPAKAVRLVVGLMYLKFTFNLSDEEVLARWVENPYWQYFCGFETMQHRVPLHPTSLTKWRNRVGADRLKQLLEETVAIAVKAKQASRDDLSRVNVDTTVQEKNVTFPTDSKLYHRALQKLAKAAKERGIELRQSYVRVAKRAAVKASRYGHAKQFRRMHREVRRLRTWLGRVIRDILRKVNRPDKELADLLGLCQRLHQQQRHDSKKLYSLHEPEVQCISKGKAHKRYEFGQKISVATTSRGNWIVGVELCQNNPYDGHTLATVLADVERTTNIPVREAHVDRGYRGHRYKGQAAVHIAGTSNRKLSWSQRRRKRRRPAIEPTIGHLKSDHRMRRCYLARLTGDAINAVLAAAGYNLRKLLKAFRPALIFSLLGCLLLPIHHYRAPQSLAFAIH